MKTPFESKLLIPFLLWIILCPKVTSAQANLTNAIFNGQNIIPNSSLLTSKKNEYTIDDVLQIQDAAFAPISGAVLNIGFQSYYRDIWLKCPLQNTTDQVLDLILASTYSTVDTAEYFLVDDNRNLQASGISGRFVQIPEDRRDYPFAKFRFSLPVDFKGVLYIRTNASQNIILPLVVWDYKNFLINYTENVFYFGIFLGGLFLFLFAMIVFYFLLKDRFFLYYLAYITCVTVYVSEVSGQFFLRIWPMLPQLNHVHFLGLSAASFAAFISLLFHTKTDYPKLDFGIKYIIVTQILSFFIHAFYSFLPSSFTEYIHVLDNCNMFTSFLFIAAVLYIGVRELILKKKVRYIWMLACLICFFVANSLLFLYIGGVLSPTQVVIVYGLFIFFEIVSIFTVIAYDYFEMESNKKKADYELMLSKQQALSNLRSGEEKERKRLARELHDSIGSMLAVIRLKIPKQTKYSDELLSHVNQVSKEVRQISHNLMPKVLMMKDLKNAVLELCSHYNTPKTKVIFYEINVASIVDETQQLELYRIIQEILKNIDSHAKATEVIVQLTCQDNIIQLTVEDNGKGFDYNRKKNGIGLQNISNRLAILKGEMDVDSQKGIGTSMLIQIPLFSKLA